MFSGRTSIILTPGSTLGRKAVFLGALVLAGAMAVQPGAGGSQSPATDRPAKAPAASSAAGKRVSPRPDCNSDSARDEAIVALNSATVQAIVKSLWEYQRQGRSADAHTVSFTVADESVNDYLAYSLNAHRRPGINSAKVAFHDHNRVSACAVLNPGDFIRALGPSLEIFGERKKDSRIVLEVEASFQVANGAVLVKIESAHIGGGPDISRVVALAASMQPEGYDLANPIPTPFGLATLTTENGILTGSTVPAEPGAKQGRPAAASQVR